MSDPDEFYRVTIYRDRANGDAFMHHDAFKRANIRKAQNRDNANRVVLIDMPSLFAYYINNERGPLVLWVRKDLIE